LLVNANSPASQWQTSSGFGWCYPFKYSSLRLRFLQGNPSVLFRFRFTNISYQTNDDGWVIDNFSIGPEYINLKALKGDTIKNINPFFTAIPITLKYQFTSPYSNTHTISTKFYLSTDSLKDSSDALLGTGLFNSGGSVSTWSTNLSFPSGTLPGYHYILYDMDEGNTIIETNESDNLGYSVVKVDSIYQSNYVESFDSLFYRWKPSFNTASSWQQGPPDYFRMEKAHSGPNAFSTTSTLGNLTLETPYLNLSTKTNQSVCFWYKLSTEPYMASSFRILLPQSRSFKTSSPVYSATVSLPNARNNNDWDCYCRKLGASFDTIVSTKFAFQAFSVSPIISVSNSAGFLRYAIDDFYVGESKPDASVNFKEGLFFSSSSTATDTLTYYLYNSGISILPP
ncbi:MAG: hypothetical protein O9353_06785, partial [Bacteroidia bacterium]|nr:hypothetical protein [Bacteroidia bacterium]